MGLFARKKSHARAEAVWDSFHQGDIQQALRERQRHEKADVDVSMMNRLSHTFSDRELEANYRAFFALTYHRKVLGMWALWALLGFGLLVRAHAANARDTNIVAMMYAVFGTTGAACVVLHWCPRVVRVVGKDRFVSLVSSFVVVLTFVTMGANQKSHELVCEDNDYHCLQLINYSDGFYGGLTYAGFGMFFVGTIPSFLHFFFLASTVLVSYLVIFIGVFHYTLHPASGMLMVFLYLALLWSHRSHDLFLRRQYLWLVETVRLTQDHLDKLEALKEHKQRIVGYLFHEIRNPINDIVLAATLALEQMVAVAALPQHHDKPAEQDDPHIDDHDHDDDDNDNTPHEGDRSSFPSAAEGDDLAGMLQVINQSADAASRVLDDALDLQKLEAGNFAFVKNSFELCEVYEPVVKALGPRFAGKGIHLTTQAAAGLSGMRVEGDLKRLRQVVHNFLSNALKFTPADGRVVVSMSAHDRNEDSVRVRVAVSDTGIGLRAEDQERMFTAWTQVRAAQTQAGGGTGLGLALSKDFIEKGHGGEIGCASPGDLGPGSTFFFFVTFHLSSHVNESVEEYDLAWGKPAAGTPRSDVVDVLLVDDSAVTRRLVGRVLKSLGVTYVECEDGSQAVEKVKSQEFRLVLMDKEMPVMDGYQAARAIRAFNTTIPIVGVTGNAMDQQRREFLACGADRVECKPIGKDGLLTVLRDFHVLA